MAVLGQEVQKLKQFQQKKFEEIRLSVKDTDFILKLIMRSTFEGVELEVAHAVLTKLAKMHKVNLES
tara:strand:- start:55 stop:255 length:201 start_codon:yes stop_codon:yes gene_type:complete